MAKRGIDLRILLLLLVIAVIIGILFWFAVFQENIAGRAFLEPPTYSEFTAASLCKNLMLATISPADIERYCGNKTEWSQPESTP